MEIFGSQNIQIVNSTFAAGNPGVYICSALGCGNSRIPNAHVLLDHDNFNNADQIGTESRVTFRGDNNPDVTKPLGFTVSHSSFIGIDGGRCSDGFDTMASADGVVVGPGNEFSGIDQSCTNGAHADPIALQGGLGIQIVGNYIHDNGSGSGGSFLWDNGGTYANNVVTCTGQSATPEIAFRGAPGWTFEHNTLGPFCDVYYGTENGPLTGEILRNNVFAQGSGGPDYNAPGCCTESYNLDSGNPGTGNITGTAVFATSPASGYYHYQLQPGSPGYLAGSDGKSMGVGP
jgi:hypothetical protein